MSHMRRFTRTALIFTAGVAVPSIALSTYLRNHPLDRSLTRRIIAVDAGTPGLATSKVLHKLVNPRNHASIADSHSLTFSKTELDGLSDEHILASFTKGFFGGWMFVPERIIFATARILGVGVFWRHVTESPPLAAHKIPTAALPPVQTSVIDGYFLIADHDIAKASQDDVASRPSSVDIVFGNADTSFSGMHRFEVERDAAVPGRVTISFASLTCNPVKDGTRLPRWLYYLHHFYARQLFRDGIREVLHEASRGHHSIVRS